MSTESTVQTDAWGIDSGYEDASENWKPTSEATRAALLAAMGGDPEAEGPSENPRVRVVRSGTAEKIDISGELRLEDGGTLDITDTLPADLPPGYHRLLPTEGGRPISVITSPGQCYLPAGLRTWGWAVQLYATRSRQSWGIGDFADLRRLASWSAAQGAGILLVNPLNAATPVVPQQASPYFPSSRRFRNPLYLRVEEIDGASEAGFDLAPLAAAGHALNAERHIDRNAVFRLKNEALRSLWSRFKGDADFDRFRREQGESLSEFGTFCRLAEEFGADWRQWPSEYTSPESSRVHQFARENEREVRYHQWLQWLLEKQLTAASQELRVMQDLPVGVDPGGADAWAWQNVLAKEVSVGAPPDVYNSLGQNWGLPPFVPHKLREAAYQPFIETIRSALHGAGGLRIDHVMGLFRLFWVPYGWGAAEGGFVRYPADDMLAIIALESYRAGAFIVGEDLGTVEPQMREKLAESKILSYRVLWFEEKPPEHYPELALAAVSTHDLPTIAGVWQETDFAAQQSIGMEPNKEANDQIRVRLKSMLEVDDEADARDVIERTHRLLATAPSAVLTATLDDALGVEERPNMPGTVDQWPNWSIALPKSVEELEADPLAHSIAEALQSRSVKNAAKAR